MSPRHNRGRSQERGYPGCSGREHILIISAE
jgi:hypothetical protein